MCRSHSCNCSLWKRCPRQRKQSLAPPDCVSEPGNINSACSDIEIDGMPGCPIAQLKIAVDDNGLRICIDGMNSIGAPCAGDIAEQ